MKSELRKCIDRVADRMGHLTSMGKWTYDEDGKPIMHQLGAGGMDIEKWFKRGKLPKSVEFFAVMATPDKERF